MTQSAGDSNRLELSFFITTDPDRLKDSFNTNDGIFAEQVNCNGGIVQIDFAILDRVHSPCRKRIGIDFEPYREGGFGRYAGTDAAILGAENCFVQSQLSAPKILAAERVGAKCSPPILYRFQ